MPADPFPTHTAVHTAVRQYPVLLDPDESAGSVGVETAPAAPSQAAPVVAHARDEETVLLLREAPPYVVFLDTGSGEVRILRRAADRETYQPYVSLFTDGGSTAQTTRIAARLAHLLAEHGETPTAV